jgi:hypothetical protein
VKLLTAPVAIKMQLNQSDIGLLRARYVQKKEGDPCIFTTNRKSPTESYLLTTASTANHKKGTLKVFFLWSRSSSAGIG